MSSPSLPPPLMTEDLCCRAHLCLHIFQDTFIATISDAGQVLYRQTFSNLDTISPDLLSFLSDRLYSLPFLTYHFAEVHIAFAPSHYVTIPAELESEEQNHKWLSTTAATMHPKADYIATYSLESTDMIRIIAAWQMEVYNFLKRTYLKARIEPLQLPIWENAVDHSRTVESRIFTLFVDSHAIDFALFHRGNLLFANRFERVPYSDQKEGGQLSDQLIFWWAALCSTLNIDTVKGDYFYLYSYQEFFDHSDFTQQIAIFTRELEQCGQIFEKKCIEDLFL